MKITRPDFYSEFKCTASDCSDSCCIGWDIYIDEFTEEIYENIEGEFGEKIRENISFDEDGDSCFKMKEKRCPFLNSENLCDIYITLGENYLCDICTEHPRFYNTHGEIREEGLGLACEEVCRLMLSRESPISFIFDEDNEEPYDDEDISDLILIREKLIKIAQDRTKTIKEREKGLLSFTVHPNILDDTKKIITIYKELESMEKKYSDMLESVNINEICDISEYENDFENVLVYMLYRYFTEENSGQGLNTDDNIYLAVSFTKAAELCYQSEKAKKEKLCLKDRINILKCLSKNIEYSDENIENIILNIQK